MLYKNHLFKKILLNVSKKIKNPANIITIACSGYVKNKADATIIINKDLSYFDVF